MQKSFKSIILSAIDAAEDGAADWGVIRDAIAASYSPKNWVTVRGHLQSLLNAGTIEHVGADAARHSEVGLLRFVQVEAYRRTISR